MATLRRVEETLPAELRAVSAELTRARASARALPGPPSVLPQTFEDAYRLQDYSIANWGDGVGGWKVGGVPPAYLDRFDAKRLAGPIFRNSIVRAEVAGKTAMPVFEGGFAAVEPEFVFALGETRAEDRMHIGCEIASSPIPNINDYGPMAVISDFGNNNGLLLGLEIPDWRSRNGNVKVRTDLDGETIGELALTDFREDALAALDFMLDLAKQRCIDLPPGTLVSSGAITGVHEAPIGTIAHLDFGDLGSLDLTLVAASPR